MLKIRLKRIGKKKEPHYRFVISEASKPRDSKTVEEIGQYNPLTTPSTIKLNKERVEFWLSKGAQPTDTVAQILVKQGILKSFKKGSKLSQGRQKKKGEAKENVAEKQAE
jgi:small subunit ribosomal protein S16